MLSKSRVSTWMATVLPPASVISRATVLMVDCGELGSGGKGTVLEASDVLFAATTTRGGVSALVYGGEIQGPSGHASVAGAGEVDGHLAADPSGCPNHKGDLLRGAGHCLGIHAVILGFACVSQSHGGARVYTVV